MTAGNAAVPPPSPGLLSPAERESFVLRNRPLVHHYVRRRYHALERRFGDDLVSAGLLGLVRASQTFDRLKLTRKGTPTRESTWVLWWVRKECIEWLTDHAATIRIPKYIRGARRQAVRERLVTVSLDGCQRPDPGGPFGGERADFLPCPSLRELGQAGDAEASARLAELHERLARAVRALPRRAGAVLRWRYEEGLTLQGCAARLGLSRERVRQIEAAALGRLRGLLTTEEEDV